MDIGSLSSIISTATSAAAILAGVYIMMRYLSRGEGFSRLKDMEMLRKQMEEIRNISIHESKEDYYKLIKEIETLKKSQSIITKEQKEQFALEIKKKLSQETVQEVLAEIQEKALTKAREDNKAKIIDEHFSSTIERLKEELFSLSKRGNLNLSIGIMTTIIGLVLLGMFVLSTPYSVKSPEIEGFIQEFIPRISLVVLIEVFAYFFLRLYKANLSEIKYFQNEITTIEAKYLALKVAVSNNSEENIKRVIENLSNTERNFILNKGQSTVDIERAKIDQQSSETIISKLTDIIGKKS